MVTGRAATAKAQIRASGGSYGGSAKYDGASRPHVTGMVRLGFAQKPEPAQEL